MRTGSENKWDSKTIKLLLLILTVLLLMPHAFSSDLIKTGVGVVANPGGLKIVKCGNNITSCGKTGECLDLTGAVFCIDEHIVETICSANNPRNVTRSTHCEHIESQLYVSNGAGSLSPINLTLYSPGTTDVINSFSFDDDDDDGLISSIYPVVDFELEFDDSGLNVMVWDLDLSELNSTTSDLIIDKVLITIPDVDVYKAYLVELPSNFTYSSITLNIEYSDTVRNENDLTFYRCGSFNPDTNTCNEDWSIIDTITVDSDNQIASVDINEFSVYALGEPEEQGTDTSTTTTTTTPATTTTPTTTSPSSSSSSSPSYRRSSSSYTPPTTTVPECAEHKPRVSVTPLYQSGVFGDTLQYGVSVMNMDSTECDSREFEFDFGIPEGWTIDHDPIGEIEPGESELIKVDITSPEEAVTNETYQLSVSVFDVDSGEESNTVYFKYFVEGLPNTETEDEDQPQSSLLTAFTSLIAQNQLLLILPAMAIIPYVFWKTYPKFMFNESPIPHRESYNREPPSKIVVKLDQEPEKQPISNVFPERIKQRQEHERIRRVVIEEIRRRALKEDELLRKNFS